MFMQGNFRISLSDMFLDVVVGSLWALVFFACVWYFYWFFCTISLKTARGPFPLPFIGHASLFAESKTVLSSLKNLIENYGPRVKLIIGLEPSITIADYESLEAVLSSPRLINKSRHYRHFHNWLGTGLLTSTGQKWQKRRKVITPTYHFRILEQFVSTFDSVIDNLIVNLSNVTMKESVDIYPLITLCTLDIICETAMGVPINAQLYENSEYVCKVKEICNIILDKTFSALQQFDVFYKLSLNCRKELKCLNVLNDFAMDIIRNRREEVRNQIDENKEMELGIKKKVAFLDLLLQSSIDGQPLSDEDIREEVSTFIFEGHDTTASAIGFALYCIAKHPEVQKKVLEEQNLLFELNESEVLSYNILQEMKYLEMVLKETLRLYPSVPFFARETTEPFTIDENLTLPKGFTVNIFAYGMHRDEKYFPNPEDFLPERFSKESQIFKHPYCYVPFSAGPRNCIGQKFAMLEMKAAISKVVRKFKLIDVGHELDLVTETILKSSNGIKIKLEKR